MSSRNQAFVMCRWAACMIALATTVANAAGQDVSKTDVILVTGASGTEQYGKQFAEWAERWESVVDQDQANLTGMGKSCESESDRERLKSALEGVQQSSVKPMWLILIGHGTSTGQTAKFNLQGPDVSAVEFGQWLKPIKRPVVVVNCSSCSGPFINRISGENRIVVTATKSGTEYNFARFGDYFAKAIASLESDLDHDDEVSVHEAFVRASGEVKRFYDAENRIASEHALIDDNGDGRGTPAKMFRGVRPIAKAKDGVQLDGKRATKITLAAIGQKLKLSDEELAKRNELEQQLDKLREQKAELVPEEYRTRLESILIELAKLYQAAETRQAD